MQGSIQKYWTWVMEHNGTMPEEHEAKCGTVYMDNKVKVKMSILVEKTK